MMSGWSSRVSVAVALITWTLPGSTHHSHGNYDLTEYRILEGTVTELHWINPHTWIYLEVLDSDGTATIWTVEGGGINAVTSRGWTRDSVQIGDTISVRCHPLRGGTSSCLFGYLKLEGEVEREFD